MSLWMLSWLLFSFQYLWRNTCKEIKLLTWFIAKCSLKFSLLSLKRFSLLLFLFYRLQLSSFVWRRRLNLSVFTFIKFSFNLFKVSFVAVAKFSKRSVFFAASIGSGIISIAIAMPTDFILRNRYTQRKMLKRNGARIDFCGIPKTIPSYSLYMNSLKKYNIGCCC